MHHECPLRVRVRHHLDWPGVAAHKAHALVHQDRRDIHADAGTAGIEAVVVLDPEVAPAGVEEHRVAFLDVVERHALRGERGIDMRRRDLVADIPRLLRLHIDQVAAGEERLDVLHADLLEPVGALDLGPGEAVVVAVVGLVGRRADNGPDMAEPVELRAHLADFGREIFVVIDEHVLAERAAGRGAGNAEREAARTEKGNARLVVAPDAGDLAVPDPLHGVERLLRRHPVGGAGLVALAPARRPPLLADRRHVAVRLGLLDAAAGHRRAGGRHRARADGRGPHETAAVRRLDVCRLRQRLELVEDHVLLSPCGASGNCRTVSCAPVRRQVKRRKREKHGR